MSSELLSDVYYALFSLAVRTSTITYDVTWTNLGPLTTVFTPPSTCATPLPSNFFLQAPFTWGFDCLRNEADDAPRPECYPSLTAYTHTVDNVSATDINPRIHPYYYSPAYSCPVGWTSATALEAPAPSTVGGYRNDLGPLGLPATGTQILCCPSGWTAGGLVQCYSQVQTSTSASYCYGTRTARARWEPTDSPRTIIAYTTPAMILLHEGGAAGVDSGQSGSDGAGGGRGLSPSAKIAIGVVIPVLLILALFIGFLLLRRRKRRKSRQQSGLVTKGPFQVDEDEPTTFPTAAGTVANQSSEMEGTNWAHRRLLSSNQAYELEGSKQQGAALNNEPLELGYLTLSRHELPSTLQAGQT